MTRWQRLLCAAAATLAFAATRAGAQQTCMLEGSSYPENSVICSHGLQVQCVNGTWQGNEGTRCNAPSGDYTNSFRPYQPKSDEPIPDYYLKKYPWLDQK